MQSYRLDLVQSKEHLARSMRRLAERITEYLDDDDLVNDEGQLIEMQEYEGIANAVSALARALRATVDVASEEDEGEDEEDEEDDEEGDDEEDEDDDDEDDGEEEDAVARSRSYDAAVFP